MKTRLMFFLPNLHGGGAEKVAVNILRILDANTYEIHLVLVEKKGDYLNLVPKNVTLHDLKVSKTLFSIVKLKAKIKEINPDVVYSSLLRTHIALYLSLMFIKNKPYIILRSPNSPKLLIDNNQLSGVMKFFIEKAYKKADLVIAQTPEMKSELNQYHKINPDKIKVFLNPIDKQLIDEKVHNCENPFNDKYINVVAAGRLTKQKGFDILIKSFNKVLSKNNNFRLHIIGNDDGEKEILLSLVDEFNLKSYINFLGFQDNPYKFFINADLYVLSSRWEGLPNTILENLYLKKPIVSTRCIPFMDKLISDGNNGILVDVEDENQLADAILNYKSIDINFINESIKSDVNQFFDLLGDKNV